MRPRDDARLVLRVVFLAAMTLLVALPAGAPVAQEPPEQPAEEAVPPAPAETTEAVTASDTVRYERADHRDPFRSLLELEKKEEGPRPPGPPGMLIEEIDLVGILAGPRGAMVLIIGSDGLGYSLTEGASLYDGRVLRIDQTQRIVVFRQEVNDPTRIKPYRDLERRLDSAS